MRTTMTLDDDVAAQASEATGMTERTALVHEGLRALVQCEAARALMALGGSDKKATAAPRRRGA
jgi:Arc/MetJ family transcription regulator